MGFQSILRDMLQYIHAKLGQQNRDWGILSYTGQIQDSNKHFQTTYQDKLGHTFLSQCMSMFEEFACIGSHIFDWDEGDLRIILLLYNWEHIYWLKLIQKLELV